VATWHSSVVAYIQPQHKHCSAFLISTCFDQKPAFSSLNGSCVNILNIRLAQAELEDMAVADAQTPYQALPDAGHRASIETLGIPPGSGEDVEHCSLHLQQSNVVFRVP